MERDMRILSTVQLLDMLREHFKYLSEDGKTPVTDYRVAMEMGWSTSLMSMYRGGKRTFGDETAIQVAEVLGKERGHILACVMLERSKSSKVRETLKVLALGGTSAAMLAVTVFDVLTKTYS